MFCVIPLLLFVSNALALPAADKPPYDLADAENYFADFVQKYDKKYENNEEYNSRFEIFKNNLVEINKLNEDHDATFEVNKFSDLTTEEFKRTHLGCLRTDGSNTTEKMAVKNEWSLNAPDSLDYRTQNLVTPVKNQGQCGSCYIFSAIANIEGQYAKKYQKLVALSEQQMLDCDKIDQGCEGGNMLNVMSVAAKLGGCEAEEDYPYTGAVSKCLSDASKIQVKVLGGKNVDTPTEDKLKAALVELGPLSAAISMPDSSMSYSGGVWSPTDCGGDLNHGILVVGYGTDAASGKDFWIIKNSWGTDWGEKGYFRLERGQGLCSLGKDMTANAEV